MERIAIISDIHGNITALNEAIKDIKSRGIKRIFSLGDSVIKCTNPDLVIDVLRKECEVNLIGNCDYTIAKPAAREKHFWSRDKIGEERAEWLANLPVSYEFYMSGHLIRLFHASPIALDAIYNPMYKNETDKALIIKDPEELFKNTDLISKTEKDPIPDIVGYGHLHTPFVVRFKNKTIFNPGSIGVPTEMLNKDENDLNNKYSTMISYIILEGIYDSKELGNISFQIVRLKYDIEKEIKSLEESDMPNKELVINNLKTSIPTVFN